MAVTSTGAWTLTGQQGVESLHFVPDLELPSIGEHDVLIKIHVASLNYREPAIAQGILNLKITDGVVPGSDGAGVVEAVGSNVSKFKPGDRVCTHLVSRHPASQPVNYADIHAGLGQAIDGTLRKYGVFHESGLVRMPAGVSFLEAATLTCSALTAWNALFGLEGKAPKQGDVVLTQGTGGVSIAALQFAQAVGATVVATTSSEQKAQKLKSLGAQHVINYVATPNWGEAAKQLTPDKNGVHIVVDVGGLSTVGESLKAVRTDGLIALAGVLGESRTEQTPLLMDCLTNLCTARGILLGTMQQFEDMNAFIDDKRVKPVVDENVFGLHEVTAAYEYLMGQRHFSKARTKNEWHYYVKSDVALDITVDRSATAVLRGPELGKLHEKR